ncbi:MAG: DNA-processing protein DprA [Aggregatilineales bacterium]|nr:DNA-protecting protein DprA [Chloroflexota bacterium]HOA24760.1 DNA-processing protein DprA [Aggregatilineales bacterium]HPV05593.1 DNA-processing protein DprA [Aggregatilineales bacterium]
MSERKYWVGFSLVKGIGPVRVRQLLECFGTLGEAWRAAPDDLSAAGLDRRALNSLIETRQRVDLDAELARLDKLGIAVLTWEDEDYPRLLANLRSIDHAPPVLYLRGSLAETDEWSLAVVGTRRATPYGRQVTHQLAGELAANGLTIVSGLARGLDAEAHQAALAAGGRTIAVLPCGLDTIYPPEHRRLAADIMQSGAVMTMFPLGTKPVAPNISARNRLISGLARGVLVTEAGEKSGALITARHALEQGREVFAVPGNITTSGSIGTNQLIQDGAHPVLSVQDVLDVLNLERVAAYADARENLPAVNDDERAVLASLGAEPLHIDELVQRCGLAVHAANSALVMLELKGMVRQVGPMTYVRA